MNGAASDQDPTWRERDAAARALARTEFARPVLLTAGAGSGKTAALVARIACWCLGPGWERARARDLEDPSALAAHVLSRCVAITFTEKAAAEMEERVSRALEALARAAPAASAIPGLTLSELGLDARAAAARATALIDAFDHLRIGTIHAFCARLVREHALRARVHPSFEIDADQRRLARLCREFVALRSPDAYGEPGDARVLRLAAHGIGPRELAAALQSACADGLGAADFARDPCAVELVRSAHAELVAALAAVIEDLAAAVATGMLRKNDSAPGILARLGELRAQWPEAHELERAIALCRETIDAVDARLSAWSRRDWSDGLAGALAERTTRFDTRCAALREALAAFADCDPALTRAFAALFAEWLDALARERRVRGLVTFDDLLASAARLVSGAPDVALAIAAGIDQLLVDEFQDTDAVQCELLRALVLAQPADSRPGLFVVGDPKQSIYGWRGADLAAFEAFRADCLAAGGREAVLLANFRSSTAVLDEVGRLCRPHLRAEAGRQWPFEALHEARATPASARFARAPRAAVEYWCSWGSAALGSARADKELAATPADAARAVEARAIAADLLALRADGLAWSDAAILLRATSSQRVYLDALRAAGIPCAPAKDKTFYRAPEIQELANLLQAALDPSDALALAGALRTSAIGAPDAALRALWLRGLPEHWASWREAASARATLTRWCAEIAAQIEAEPDAAAAGLARVRAWPHAVVDGLCTLLALRASQATLRVDAWVDAWRAWLLLEESAELRYLGAWRSANVARALDQLEAALLDDVRAPHELARALREGQSGAHADAIALPRDETSAVAVLTLHAAKGLEWPVVYLADLHREPNPEESAPVRMQRGARGLALSVAGRHGLAWHATRREREAREAAETARLLYVAATRAADRLVLLGSFPEPSRRTSRAPLLDLVLRREGGPAFEHVRDEAGHLDADGVRWKLPGVHGARVETASRTERGAREVAALGASEAAATSERVASGSFATSERASDAAARELREQIARDAEHYRRARAAARAHEQRACVASFTHTAERDGADPLDTLEPRDDSRALDTAESLGAPRTRAASESAAALSSEPAGAADTDDRKADDHAHDDHAHDDHADAHADATRLDARTLGTLVHAALERALDEAELARRAAALGAAEPLAQARAALELLSSPEARELVARVRSLEPHVLGREVPIVAPPDAHTGPTLARTGRIDLVYRDPRDGRVVVVDYKTDRVGTHAALLARRDAHAPQLAAYARALRDALAQPVRAELWFLRAGRVETIDVAER